MASDKGNLIQMRFGVAEHDVSVVTAVTSLMSVADMLKEIGTTSGNEKIDVTITTPEPGSVLFYICVVVASNIHQIIPAINDSVDLAKRLLEIFSISEKTKGERPAEIKVETRNGSPVTVIKGNKGNTTIINGDVHIAANLIARSSAVQRGLKTIGEAGKKDDALNFLSFQYKESEEVTIGGEVFDYLEKIGEDTDFEEEVIEDAPLIIIRPSFYQNLKSDFYFQGSRITCIIKDEGFYKEIDRGERFAKGDALRCRLVIKRKYDLSVDAFINHTYVIERVLKHIPRGEQSRLDLG